MKKTLKQICSLAGAAFLAVSLTACGASGSNSSPASSSTAAASGSTPSGSAEAVQSGSGETQRSAGENYKIGIANREITNDYNRLIAYGAQDVFEAAGCDVTMTDAEADVQKHSENIESLLNSGIDGLMIQLGDNDQLASICKQAKDKGIPVVTAGIGSHIDNTICDVNGDDATMAVMLADAIFDAIDYQGDVYVFYVPGAPLLENRLAVLQAVASMYSGINIVPMSTEHNVSKVQTQTQELLTSNPEKGSIAAIVGTYDSLISGAVESVRQAGRTEIVMGGIDGDQVSFQMLFEDDSPFKVSVVMDASSIGKTAANTLLDVLDGKVEADSISSKISTACYTATLNNGVAAAEEKWGSNVWDTIGISKEDVEKAHPQTQELQIITPVVP